MKNFHEKQIYIVLAVVHIKYTIVFIFCKVLEKYILFNIFCVLFLVVESSTFLGVKFFKHGVYTSPCRHAPKAPVAFRAHAPRAGTTCAGVSLFYTTPPPLNLTT